jgi:hypothetical protein
MSAEKKVKTKKFRFFEIGQNYEIFDFVKIPPISKSHILQATNGTYAISVPLGIPDILYHEHRAGLQEHPAVQIRVHILFTVHETIVVIALCGHARFNTTYIYMI